MRESSTTIAKLPHVRPTNIAADVVVSHHPHASSPPPSVLWQHGAPPVRRAAARAAFGYVARLADAPQICPHARRIGDHRDELHAAAALRALEHVDGKPVIPCSAAAGCGAWDRPGGCPARADHTKVRASSSAQRRRAPRRFGFSHGSGVTSAWPAGFCARSPNGRARRDQPTSCARACRARGPSARPREKRSAT